MATRKTPSNSKNPAVKTPRTTRTLPRAPAVSDSRLDELIDDACTDAHDEDEQLMGFMSCIEEHIRLPFDAVVLGLPVQVTDIVESDRGEAVAVCQREGHTQRISLGELPLPDPPPKGFEWILAYRRWARHR